MQEEEKLHDYYGFKTKNSGEHKKNNPTPILML
jgi:hypothetical protein